MNLIEIITLYMAQEFPFVL